MICAEPDIFSLSPGRIFEPLHRKINNLHMLKNNGADQLRSNCKIDQRPCFRYTNSTIPLLLKSEIFTFLACLYDCTGWFVLDLV